MTIFLYISTVSAEICKNQTSKSSSYLQFEKQRQDLITKLSNQKIFATDADKTLNDLLNSKSKILVNWMNKRKLTDKSETIIIKKWREYHLNNFVIAQFEQLKGKKKQIITTEIESIYKQAYNSEQIKKFKNLFKQAQKESLKLIKNYKIDNKIKENLLKRIEPIELYFMTNLKKSKYNKNPLDVFSWGVAYDPSDNKINMGLEALMYNSDSSIFSVFAHEIGHSFDSCRWPVFVEGKNPFETVYNCLRSEKSVNAKKRDDSKMQLLIKQGMLTNELAMALKMNPTCNNTSYPPIGTQADQLPEVFADWFSAEVVANTDFIDTNLRQDLCAVKKLIKGSSYIKNKDRLEKLYLSHPKIAKKLKIKPVSKYCKL